MTAGAGVGSKPRPEDGLVLPFTWGPEAVMDRK